MAKKQNKPTKTCSDCIHEFACRGWTGGRYISDDTASQCPNHETVKESGAYLCGVLDERKRKKTNADRIRSMNDEELAMCLYEVGYEERWDDPKYALKWLMYKKTMYEEENMEQESDIDDIFMQ